MQPFLIENKWLIIKIMNIFLALVPLTLVIFFTFAVKKYAFANKVFDTPNISRKLHQEKIPLLGGLGIYFAFFLTILIFRSYILSGELSPLHWFGVFFGSSLLMIGGVLDDKYNLPPKHQIIFPLLAILFVIIGGVGIEKISNPVGGFILLDNLQIPIFSFGSQTFYFVPLTDVFTFLWLMGMMYTTKLLDGVDGLVTSVIAIGSFIIFLFTFTTKYYQPDIGIAAIILFFCCVGFLFFNWHPAKIFLGEGGSLLLGFLLGVLAIISGGKVAIALLVMGVPILDVFWTIIRRVRGGKNPFKFSDRGHLHFKLLDSGFSQRGVVFIYSFLSLIFGLSALFLQSSGKLYALLGLVFVMVLFVYYFSRKNEVD